MRTIVITAVITLLAVIVTLGYFIPGVGDAASEAVSKFRSSTPTTSSTAVEEEKDPEAIRLKAEAARIRAQIELDEAEAARKEAQRRREVAGAAPATPATPPAAASPASPDAEPPASPVLDPGLASNMRGAKERGNTFKRTFAVVPHDGTWSKWTKVGQCIHWSHTLPNNDGWPVKMQYYFSDGQVEEFDTLCNLESFNKLLLRDGRVVNWIRYRWNDGVTDSARKGLMFTINIERHPDMPEPDLEMPAIDPPAAAPKEEPTSRPAPATATSDASRSTNDSSAVNLTTGHKVLGNGSYRGKGTMAGRGSYTGNGTLVGPGSYQGPGTLR